MLTRRDKEGRGLPIYTAVGAMGGVMESERESSASSWGERAWYRLEASSQKPRKRARREEEDQTNNDGQAVLRTKYLLGACH